jgi:hypothetical protein
MDKKTHAKAQRRKGNKIDKKIRARRSQLANGLLTGA